MKARYAALQKVRAEGRAAADHAPEEAHAAALAAHHKQVARLNARVAEQDREYAEKVAALQAARGSEEGARQALAAAGARVEMLTASLSESERQVQSILSRQFSENGRLFALKFTDQYRTPSMST